MNVNEIIYEDNNYYCEDYFAEKKHVLYFEFEYPKNRIMYENFIYEPENKKYAVDEILGFDTISKCKMIRDLSCNYENIDNTDYSNKIDNILYFNLYFVNINNTCCWMVRLVYEIVDVKNLQIYDESVIDNARYFDTFKQYIMNCVIIDNDAENEVINNVTNHMLYVLLLEQIKQIYYDICTIPEEDEPEDDSDYYNSMHQPYNYLQIINHHIFKKSVNEDEWNGHCKVFEDSIDDIKQITYSLEKHFNKYLTEDLIHEIFDYV